MANVKLHNGGTLGLGTSRNVSGISNSSVQQCCDNSFYSVLLFTFSALREPGKELELSFTSGEKYVNKIFLLFSGSQRALKCHRTKCLNHVNYQSKLPLQKFFSWSTPLPPGFPESLIPAPVRISRIPSVVGVWIFLEQHDGKYHFCHKAL